MDEGTGSHVTVVAFPVIDSVPTLPYYWKWEAWSQHVEHCAQCAFVIHETEDQALEELCWEGRGLNFAIKHTIRTTAELAVLN